jgi:hypothetical protein
MAEFGIGQNPNSKANLLPNFPPGAQKKGAYASMRAKKKKRELREVTEYLLSLPINPGRVEVMKSIMDAKSKNLSVLDAMVVAQIKKAVSGDTKAFRALSEIALIEKTAVDTTRQSTDDRLLVALQSRVTLADEPDGTTYEEDLEDGNIENA